MAFCEGHKATLYISGEDRWRGPSLYRILQQLVKASTTYPRNVPTPIVTPLAPTPLYINVPYAGGGGGLRGFEPPPPRLRKMQVVPLRPLAFSPLACLSEVYHVQVYTPIPRIDRKQGTFFRRGRKNKDVGFHAPLPPATFSGLERHNIVDPSLKHPQ